MNLRDSKTYDNLMAAFAGESQARTKYTYYEQVARSEGYEMIGDIFKETAANELAHAKLWFQYVHEGMPDIKLALKDAASGEHFEWSEMYKEFANTAKEEGFDVIAKLFEQVGDIESHHEKRFKRIEETLNKEEMFTKEQDISWICKNCGHTHVGKSAPEPCPVCKYPKAYFAKEVEQY